MKNPGMKWESFVLENIELSKEETEKRFARLTEGQVQEFGNLPTRLWSFVSPAVNFRTIYENLYQSPDPPDSCSNLSGHHRKQIISDCLRNRQMRSLLAGPLIAIEQIYQKGKIPSTIESCHILVSIHEYP